MAFVLTPGFKPLLETAAEIQLYGKLGANLVGMSTVWEVIALKQLKTEILGISCVTNFGTGISRGALNHKEVLQTTKRTEKNFSRLVEGIIEKI